MYTCVCPKIVTLPYVNKFVSNEYSFEITAVDQTHRPCVCTYGGRRNRKNRSEVKSGLALLSSVA